MSEEASESRREDEDLITEEEENEEDGGREKHEFEVRDNKFKCTQFFHFWVNRCCVK